MRSPYAALFHTVIQGKIDSPWKTIALSGLPALSMAIAAWPDVAVSSPARMRSKVVLRHPEGPTIVQKLPRAISSEKPSKATNGPVRVGNILVRPAIAIFGAASVPAIWVGAIARSSDAIACVAVVIPSKAG